MKSLKDLSLENISDNLQINQQILRLKNFKIPPALCDSIYLTYLRNIRDINEKDLEIFYSADFSISTLFINRKFYPYPQFFLKINAKDITEIKFSIDLNRNWIECVQNILKRLKTINKLIFHFIEETNENRTMKNVSGVVDTFNQFSLISNQTLTELKIYFSNENKFDIKEKSALLKMLKMSNKLKIFHLLDVFCAMNESENNLSDFYLSESLEELYLTIPLHSTFQEIKSLFQSLKNLRRVSIIFGVCPKKENIMACLQGLLTSSFTLEQLEIHWNNDVIFEYFDFIISYFPLLRRLHLSQFFAKKLSSKFFERRLSNRKGLTSLKLTCSKLSFNTLKMVLNVLENQVALNEFILDKIVFSEMDANLFQDIINGFSKLTKSLEITLDVYVKDYEDCTNFIRFIKNCKNINFSLHFFSPGYFHDSILKVLESNQACNYYQEINLPSFNIINTLEGFNFSMFLESFRKLEVMDLSFKKIEVKMVDDILSALVNSAETLKTLDLNCCKLEAKHSEKLKNLLQNCKRLEELKLDGNNGLLVESIINEIENLNTSLVVLSFSCSIKNSTNVFHLLGKLRNIRSIIISFNDGQVTEEMHEKFSNIMWDSYIYSLEYYPRHLTSYRKSLE